ncbi:MAG TPA: Mut7-C RNAse domain-containing protein [Thermodesulfobacteriota bacterium]|nr:Mut7-C RNAse domain-containing protein [Thermodesulfobacteriota bacterium]
MKFITDRTVGKLARKLRAMGFDVVSFERGELEEAAVIAVSEGRILLTRSRRAPKSFQGLTAMTLRSDHPEEQAREVLAEFGLEAPAENFFTRCLVCNVILKPLAKEEVEGRVPDFVYRGYETFHTCPRCRRVYWPGTHLQRMKQRIGRAIFSEKGEKAK